MSIFNNYSSLIDEAQNLAYFGHALGEAWMKGLE